MSMKFFVWFYNYDSNEFSLCNKFYRNKESLILHSQGIDKSSVIY